MMSNCDNNKKSGTQGAADYVSDVPVTFLLLLGLITVQTLQHTIYFIDLIKMQNVVDDDIVYVLFHLFSFSY